MPFTPTEMTMWLNDPGEREDRPDDRAINERYVRGEGRIVIESNREKLPGFVNQLKDPNYMDLRPFYQRRPRWDVRTQSLLIESFIMNIPVPPVFLYERDFNAYEVIDGQQRITALRDFYANTFKLRGIERWPELNGRTYAQKAVQIIASDGSLNHLALGDFSTRATKPRAADAGRSPSLPRRGGQRETARTERGAEFTCPRPFRPRPLQRHL